MIKRFNLSLAVMGILLMSGVTSAVHLCAVSARAVQKTPSCGCGAAAASLTIGAQRDGAHTNGICENCGHFYQPLEDNQYEEPGEPPYRWGTCVNWDANPQGHCCMTLLYPKVVYQEAFPPLHIDLTDAVVTYYDKAYCPGAVPTETKCAALTTPYNMRNPDSWERFDDD